MYIYNNLEKLLFHGISCDSYTSDNIMSVDNTHYAMTHLNQSKKCLIISKGNAGNLDTWKSVVKKVDDYFNKTYDIFVYEYPGYGCLKGKTSLTKCCRELRWWISHLNEKYDCIDLYGVSLGGGIQAETLAKYSQFDPDTYKLIRPKVQNMYLESTFASITTIASDINKILGYVARIRPTLNTIKNIEIIYQRYPGIKVCVLHSKNDEIIKHKHAELLCKAYPQIKYVEIYGNHSGTYFKTSYADILSGSE